jgi:hypothetical protein
MIDPRRPAVRDPGRALGLRLVRARAHLRRPLVTAAQEIGARIRQLCIERGLSVASSPAPSSTRHSAVRNWEAGRSRPLSSAIACIERAMRVSLGAKPSKSLRRAWVSGAGWTDSSRRCWGALIMSIVSFILSRALTRRMTRE